MKSLFDKSNESFNSFHFYIIEFQILYKTFRLTYKIKLFPTVNYDVKKVRQKKCFISNCVTRFPKRLAHMFVVVQHFRGYVFWSTVSGALFAEQGFTPPTGQIVKMAHLLLSVLHFPEATVIPKDPDG